MNLDHEILIGQILIALGLQDLHVKDLELHFHIDEIPYVKVVREIDGTELEQVASILAKHEIGDFEPGSLAHACELIKRGEGHRVNFVE